LAKNKKLTYISREEALKKLQRYCAYQDRCHKEVRSKLLDLGVYGHDLEEVIVALIQDNFLNEERYAQSFVRGKLRMKHWGRNKILQELKRKNISAYCIKKGMQEIEEEEYLKILEGLVEKKDRLTKESDKFKKRRKLADYAIRRGFEPSLVWEIVKRQIPDNAPD
jgi:regulatory protein